MAEADKAAELGLCAQKGFLHGGFLFSGTLMPVLVGGLGDGGLCPADPWCVDFMLHPCLERGWERCCGAPQVPSKGPWSFWKLAQPMAPASLCAYVGSAPQPACPEKYNRAVLLFGCCRFLCHSSHEKQHRQRAPNKWLVRGCTGRGGGSWPWSSRDSLVTPVMRTGATRRSGTARALL